MLRNRTLRDGRSSQGHRLLERNSAHRRHHHRQRHLPDAADDCGSRAEPTRHHGAVGGVRSHQHLRRPHRRRAQLDAAAHRRGVRLSARGVRRRRGLRVRLDLCARHDTGDRGCAGHRVRGIPAQPASRAHGRIYRAGDRHRRYRHAHLRQRARRSRWRGGEWGDHRRQSRGISRDYSRSVPVGAGQRGESGRGRTGESGRTGARRGVGHLHLRRLDCGQHDRRRGHRARARDEAHHHRRHADDRDPLCRGQSCLLVHDADRHPVAAERSRRADGDGVDRRPRPAAQRSSWR